MVPSHGDCVDGVILLLIVQRSAEGCAGPESLPTQLVICRQQKLLEVRTGTAGLLCTRVQTSAKNF